jgi:Ca2+-binding EF-hand superfamily protein
LFRAWDRNGDGKVTAMELRKGLDEVGISVSRDELAILFASLDPDSSGAISAKELAAALNNRPSSRLEQQPGPGMPSVLAMAPSLGRGKSGMFGMKGVVSVVDGGGISADAPVEEVAEALRQALSTQRARVADLFATIDEDRSGMISRHEFRGALAVLGLSASGAVTDALFAGFDPDNSGAIGYKELQAALKPARPEPASLQGGAASPPPSPRVRKGGIRVRRAQQTTLKEGKEMFRKTFERDARNLSVPPSLEEVHRRLRRGMALNWISCTELFHVRALRAEPPTTIHLLLLCCPSLPHMTRTTTTLPADVGHQRRRRHLEARVRRGADRALAHRGDQGRRGLVRDD